MTSLYIRSRLFERWLASDVEPARCLLFSEEAEDRHCNLKLDKQISALHPDFADRSSSSSPKSFQGTHLRSGNCALPRKQSEDQVQATPVLTSSAMADQEISSILNQLHQSLSSHDYSQSPSLLSRAKICLLKLNALVAAPQTSRQLLLAARETLELGALVSIRLQDPEAFTRYFQQLQPFYNLPAHILPREGGNRSKVTGLYLLLQLSQGDYAGFHTTLEALETQAQQTEGQAVQRGKSSGKGQGKGLEDDAFVQYPIRLEQALMEGSYDRVWGETKSERVPSEEFAIFSDVCHPMSWSSSLVWI